MTTIQPLEREHLLLESSLSATSVAIGLTAIRRHNFADKGSFYAGMFSVTIGLERLLKLVVVLDHVRGQGQFPTNRQLKYEFGHQIDVLATRTRTVNAKHDSIEDESFFDDSLVTKIITFLAKFANASRYYNLDFVTGAARANDQEPLQQWAREIAPELVRRHHRMTKRMMADIEAARAFENEIAAVVDHVDDDGTPIRTLEGMAYAALFVETKQKYAVYYLHKIVMFGIGLLEHLDANTLGISEPFRSIWLKDQRAIVGRKSWHAHS